MLQIMNSVTGKIIGQIETPLPSIGKLTDLRTIINREYGYSYSLIWQNRN